MVPSRVEELLLRSVVGFCTRDSTLIFLSRSLSVKASAFPEEEELAEPAEEEAIFFRESTRMMRSSAGEVERRLRLPLNSGRSKMLLLPRLMAPLEALPPMDCLGYTMIFETGKAKLCSSSPQVAESRTIRKFLKQRIFLSIFFSEKTFFH